MLRKRENLMPCTPIVTRISTAPSKKLRGPFAPKSLVRYTYDSWVTFCGKEKTIRRLHLSHLGRALCWRDGIQEKFPESNDPGSNPSSHHFPAVPSREFINSPSFTLLHCKMEIIKPT
jgi:hypothetical protein